MTKDLEQIIDERIGEVRTEALDISFGEIVNLHKSNELLIAPEYQRLFRWSEEQQSRLIESILLELPIPPIFVIENAGGIFELIDGLQRTSSILRFIDSTTISADPLALTGCDLIPELDGLKFTDLSLTLRLRVKRSAVRVVVIKRQSSQFLRFEMFKRLNTGGSLLAPQEIRNVTARILGDRGAAFYTFLQRCASLESYKLCIAPIPEREREQKADEELALRFFALKNYQDGFRGSVRDWLDDYMERVILEKSSFDQDEEIREFSAVFDALAVRTGDSSFVRYRNNVPLGGLAPAYFEAVAMAVHRSLARVEEISKEQFAIAIRDTVQGNAFRDVTGPGANSKQKLEARIALVQHALAASAG